VNTNRSWDGQLVAPWGALLLRFDAATGQRRAAQHLDYTLGSAVSVTTDAAGSAWMLADPNSRWRGIARLGAADWNVVAQASAPGGASRLLWRRADGRTSVWHLSASGAILGTREYGPYPGWSPAHLAVAAGDGGTRLLWQHDSGRASAWRLSRGGDLEASAEFDPPGQEFWRAAALAVGADNKTRLLWRSTAEGSARGSAQVWRLDVAGAQMESVARYGPYAGWTVEGLSASAAAPDNASNLLWSHRDGRASVWRLAADGAHLGGVEYGPFPGWGPAGVASGNAGNDHVLWQNLDGRASLWTLNPAGGIAASAEYGPYPAWSPSLLAAPLGPGNGPTLLWRGSDSRVSHWRFSPFAEAVLGTDEFGPLQYP